MGGRWQSRGDTKQVSKNTQSLFQSKTKHPPKWRSLYFPGHLVTNRELIRIWKSVQQIHYLNLRQTRISIKWMSLAICKCNSSWMYCWEEHRFLISNCKSSRMSSLTIKATMPERHDRLPEGHMLGHSDQVQRWQYNDHAPSLYLQCSVLLQQYRGWAFCWLS
jgi:hypothetical protein